MGFVYLAIAIVCEVAGTSALQATDGLTRYRPLPLVIIGYGASFFFMALALRAIPVGIAYAIWSGFGNVLIATIGWVVFDQKLDAPALAGLALIVAGVAVVNLSGTLQHR